MWSMTKYQEFNSIFHDEHLFNEDSFHGMGGMKKSTSGKRPSREVYVSHRRRHEKDSRRQISSKTTSA